jgi:hypothetical protein
VDEPEVTQRRQRTPQGAIDQPERCERMDRAPRGRSGRQLMHGQPLV